MTVTMSVAILGLLATVLDSLFLFLYGAYRLALLPFVAYGTFGRLFFGLQSVFTVGAFLNVALMWLEVSEH